ncbi:MAG: glycosyltransferase family 39 protein [Verrucomicrobiae bacterium]|nr:glycosyltransferase family 39 protein [Verrucomicrobiae bacterium]
MKSLSKKLIGGAVFFLSCIAFLSFMWPCYRAFLPIMVNTNEGWNAFFADAAMGKMPLYPSLDRLITNNYPPLSFYVVGGFGKILGDPILAGRILSLLAIIIIAFCIGKIVRQFGGSLQAAVVGSAYFVGTICLSFRWYVGVNDPQLLAQAIMIVGFFLFLRAMERDANYWLPLLIMVVAGFLKHNIITLPLSAMLGLVLWRRWRALRFSLLFSGVLVAIGLACCYCCYGADFFHNFLTPRSWMPEKTMDALGDLQSLVIGMFLWLLMASKEWQQRRVQFITIMMIMALVLGLVQRLGSGVFVNAQFDLVIVVAIAMGLGFQLLVDQKKELSQLLWLLFLTGPLIVSPDLFSFTQIFSFSGRAAIKQEEQEMNQLIEEVRTSPVDVFCESYITYRAGKPFVVDAFNVEERIKAKKLPADAVDRLIKEGKLVEVKREWLVGEE